jgi:hypothetical protein
MAEIEPDEIQRWLDSMRDTPSDIASRVYMDAKRSHTGERPKWCRIEWHNLDGRYREFLVSIARAAMEYERKFGVSAETTEAN